MASGGSSGNKKPKGLKRALSGRQVQMLVIGGVIGVELFYGAALSVKIAGPAVLIGFILCGAIAGIVMRALGEMTVERPVSGSFRDYAETHLGRGVGFVTGWVWWFFWTATVMSELAAIGKLIQFWFLSTPNTMNKATASTVRMHIGSIFIMLCAFPWTYLTAHSGSPYVLLFARVGIPLAATVVNIIIITSGLSSCNTGLYGGSRMLYSMTVESKPRSPLARVNRNQVPHGAVWLTALMISIGTLITYLAPNYVYIWMTSASAFASLWTWGVILVSELVFCARAKRDGVTVGMPMPWWPTLPVVGLGLLVVAFIAIVTSPYTRVSVWSGLIFLFLLMIDYAVRGRKTYRMTQS